MNTRIVFAAIGTLVINSVAFAQMTGYGGSGMPQGQPPPSSTGGMQQTTTSKTKTVYPQGVKGYLDSQMASSKDKKFHVTFNGKDLALTPAQFHEEKKLGGTKSATSVDMKGADGKIYKVDFVLSGGQVISGSVAKASGKTP